MKESSVWVAVQEQYCYGVVLYGFGSEFDIWPHCISANLGETLQIRAECRDWFYVSKMENWEHQGIIPKSYVHIQECNVIHQGDAEVIIPCWPPIIQEITDVLKEWHKISRQHFLTRHQFFLPIRGKIMELHDCRKAIMCPNLTVEGLKQLRKRVAQVIDAGNNMLKLDMTVRDAQGYPLNPNITSAIQLFRQHQKTSERLEKAFIVDGGGSGIKITRHHSRSLLMICEKVTWKIVEECEVRFFLYDADEGKPFSEGGQINLQANSNFFPFRFLFTDLGKRDEERSRIFLIAYIVRIGPMDFREDSTKRDVTPFSQKTPSNQKIRRPWGVAAKDITKLFKIENPTTPTGTEAEDEVTILSFSTFGDNDCLKTLLLKAIDTHQIKDKDKDKEKDAEKGFLCSVSIISGTPAEIHEDQPLVLRGNPIVVRKMGFPEVILPNDVRNDLYLTLVSGEFHKGSKSSDKNIEVTVTAHSDNGNIIPGIIFGGSGSVQLDQYKSIVYYHECRPKWEETFKVSLPMFLDQFSKAHLKFSFKHRSSRESKDISEKPFALAYVRLRLEKGTALPDGDHKPAIFKVDPKLYREKDVHYLLLPSMLSGGHTAKRSCPGLTWAPKDSFAIRTTLCSTQFTQNDHLLELLQWSTSLKSVADNEIVDENTRTTLCQMLLNNLKRTLQNVTTVRGEEIVKFLPYVFNALFSILVESVESIMSELFSSNETVNAALIQSQLLSENCDKPVFDCLIYIFGLILDHKFQNFKSVLCHYIEEEFSATMAYTKLTKELVQAISNPVPDKALKIMKSLEFFIKFIVRSFSIRIKLRDMDIGADEDGSEEEAEFERSIELLFSAMGGLLANPELPFVNAQKGCLKYVPTIIEPLCTVFSERRLSELLVELIVRVEHGRIAIPKLSAVMDVVKSKLFQNSVARTTLLPIVADNIKHHLPGNDEDLKRRSQEHAKTRSRNKLGKMIGLEAVEGHLIPLAETSRHSEETHKCVELLSEVMDILYSTDIGPTHPDISYMMHILLRDIIYSIGTIGDNDPMAGNMVAILMSLLRQMPPGLFSKFMYTLKGDSNKHELFKFLNDALVVFKNLFSKCFFSSNWAEMILLQNNILLGALEQFTETVKKEFGDPFELMPWNNFFQCAVSFLTQESLQLETFSLVKTARILSQYGDMRLRAAELIRQMWFSLGEKKRIQFVPSMVGTFLDMALVPEPTLRRIAIPIFFDMMRCDFANNGTFQQVEDELINRLVESMESGKGDPGFRDIFHETMVSSCQNDHTGLSQSGLRMVDTVTKLLELLLEYREVIDEIDAGSRMTCIVNLIDFSMEVGRKELYLRYLYKLHDLHVRSQNFTEAGFTLKLHSRQLEWTEDEVPAYLRSPKYPHLTTQVELKEALYKDIINYFDDENSKSWECAIEVCDELRQQYAEELYSYSQLPELLLRMANLYEKILKSVRFEPGYFRVAFFGRGFPSFLQDKIFVYRGRRSEKLNDFETRMLERFPHAELLRSLNKPSTEQRNSYCQLLQICNVDPVMNTESNNKRMSGMKYAEESIRRYYRSNDVNKFVYSRPYHKEPKDHKNEFASLWLDRYTLWTASSFPGNMSWFSVIRETCVQVKPILYGIETLTTANQKLHDLVMAHCSNLQEDLGSLSLKLNGVLDPAVMGGISNYEKAFFIPEYLEKEPDDLNFIITMKKLVLAQVPLIGECLRIHREKAPESLKPLHQKLEERYQEFLDHLEEAYADMDVNVREMKDESLQRDMERFQKKRLALTKKGDKKAYHVITRNSDGIRGSNVALSRSKSSFSSTLSVYSGFSQNKNTATKSMVSIPRPGISHRRSTQSSFDEGMGGGIGRGNLFLMGTSMNKLSSITGEENETNSSRNSSVSSLQLNANRMSMTMDNRKSGQWINNGDARSSGISISSTTGTSSRNSMESRDEVEEEPPPQIAPPLPPKQREATLTSSDELRSPTMIPPALPPKKPPLKNL